MNHPQEVKQQVGYGNGFPRRKRSYPTISSPFIPSSDLLSSPQILMPNIILEVEEKDPLGHGTPPSQSPTLRLLSEKKLTRLDVNANGPLMIKDCVDRNIINKSAW
ncbi:unnamed protein product [Prunus brigantina]